MTPLRKEESGFALVVTMMLILMALAIGLVVVSRADTQSNLSAHERTRESSFDLAEAALHAQVLQLSRTWPTSTSPAPSSCTPTSGQTICPLATAIGNGYTSQDYSSSCLTAPTTPIWQTSIRDNQVTNGVAEQYWTTAVMQRAAYDANGDGAVWVRSTASVQCDRVSIVSLAGRTSVAMDFPDNVVSANWFATSNQGKKVIVDTLGTYATPPRPATSPSKISLRCQNLTGTCANYQSGKGQIQPPLVETNSGAPATTLTLAQLQSLERQAQAAGTLWTSGPPPQCPGSNSNLSSQNGAPVVIQGHCDVTIGSNTIVNSSTTPGVLVIEDGTLTLQGSAQFWGLIYIVNKQGSTGSCLTIQGNATVTGVTSVDGACGITAGSSKTNLIYDNRASKLLRGESGATLSKNSFRVLPPSTP